MQKIAMKTPLVEMDGDEMTRVLWRMIKDKLILPFVDLKTEYYDLGLPNRDATNDQVTIDAAEANKRLGVSVKCATITPNEQRMSEYNLKQKWLSPNGTIRAILDGTVFRAPILVKGVSPVVRTWQKPITIARHAYGDIYRAREMKIPGPGKCELVFTGADGARQSIDVFDFKGSGVVLGMHNLDSSIESFARACFRFALDQKQDLWFSTKDTISKTYDGHFKEVFQRIFDAEFKAQFDAAGIEFGSLAMMTSVLVSPNGQFEYEAAHGTVTRHYYRYLKGEKTSTNPVATIFAWSGALRKRGELDGLAALMAFADRLERATLDTIEGGTMTGDLKNLFEGEARAVTSEEFLDAVAQRLA